MSAATAAPDARRDTTDSFNAPDFPARFFMGERMAPARMTFPAGRLAECKALFEDHQGSRPAISEAVDEDVDAAAMGAQVVLPTDAAAEPETDEQFDARVGRALRRQLDIIERLQTFIVPLNSLHAGRSARNLSLISKPLLDIAGNRGAEPNKDANEDDADDDMPRDIDDFRNELARRIRSIVDARRRGRSSEGDDPAGSGSA